MDPVHSFPSFASLTEALEPVLDPDIQVKYKNVNQIFPQQIWEKAKKDLREYIDEWKNCYRDIGGEHSILCFARENKYAFTPIDFGIDHKLVFPETFINLFSIGTDPFSKSHGERLKRIAKDIMIIAIERFAFEKKLVGKHDIRMHLKTLNYYIDTPLKNPETRNLSLRWHYDYCAEETLSIPLPVNDFTQDAPGDILLARNGFEGKCSGLRGDNIIQSKPIENTITKVPYPENGGLLFGGERGAQLHCPSPITLPVNTTGLITKLLIQVVSYDHEWMDKQNK